MRHDIVLPPEAVEDMNGLKANVRAGVRDAIEQNLRHQYRLRVDDEIRVFCDVTDEAIQVLAIVPKSEADAWCAKHGESDETSSTV